MLARDALSIAFDLAVAFARYPLCEWILESAPRPDLERQRLFEILVSDVLAGKAEFVRASDYGGVAVWVRSEGLPLVPAEQGRAVYRAFRRKLSVKVVRRLLKLHVAMNAHHPTQTHDYLFLLGVHPSFQGTGIGTQLVEKHLAESDKAGRECFLETSDPKNLAFYEKLNFGVIDRYAIDSLSPTSWGMWRSPKVA